MKTNRIIPILLIILLLQPFGCQTVRKIARNKHHTKLDSTFNVKTDVNVKKFDIQTAIKHFTEDKSREGSKITYTKTITTTKPNLSIDGVYSIDSIQPVDGSLNFTNENTGEKINVAKSGSKLKITQKSKAGVTKINKFEQLQISNFKEKSSKSGDSLAKSAKGVDSAGASKSKGKVSKSEKLEKIQKETKRKGISWYWWVIGLLVAVLVVGFRRKLVGRE